MRVDDLIDELYDMLEKAWSLPLSRGRAVLDGEQVRQILDEIREALPQEIHQARAIVADRSQILADAKREADTVLRVSQERAKALVAQDEITRQAQQKANDLVGQAQAKTREMRKATNDYVDDLMKRTEDELAGLLAEARKVRQNIKASQRTSPK
ncbi:MAG: ATPase [Oscillospiraceae bacterium]|jgi:cell division septum initiation protein DivIVA|nr:ATPase [Oscillospiraceae bacterium]MCI1991025.1 ATPase [Oscillospiraceae bacterium]MCI2035640.1 ATPase [Oscillospiraceae bacterium]